MIKSKTRQFPRVQRGEKRQWTRCLTCGNVAYYDYVPYGLGNPVMWLPCGHGLTVRLDQAVDFISEDDAAGIIATG